MEHYLQKALVEDISPADFLNVIRILRGQSPIQNGVGGEGHYSVVAKRERDRILNVPLVENIIEEDEVVEIAKECIKNSDKVYY